MDSERTGAIRQLMGMIGRVGVAPSIRYIRIFSFSINILIYWLFSFSALAADRTATGVRIGGDEQATRFVLDLSEKVDFAVTLQKEPALLRIALPFVNFNLPGGTSQLSRGLVSRFRYGMAADGGTEVILDLLHPATITNTLMIPPKKKMPARLVIDLAAAPVDSARSSSQPEPTEAGGRAAMPSTGQRYKVVIDPGHGGIDPGAVSPSKVKEKDVVLSFATELGHQLEKLSSIEVFYTRTDDRFISLADRVAFARSKQADLFIAVHADIVRGKSARGTTIYTLSDQASDAEAEELARKENRADIIAGVNLSTESSAVTDVLIELAQRESKAKANLFAKDAIEKLTGVTLMTGKPLRSAGFVVLKSPDVPSVLVELGYLSNKADETLLTDHLWQSKTAEALAAAVASHAANDLPLSTGSLPAVASP